MSGRPSVHGRVVTPVLWILVVTPVLVGTVVQFAGVISLVAAGAVGLLLLVVVLLAHRTRSGEPLSSVTLLILALLLALLFSLAMAVRSAGTVQQFALYGQTKRLTLPVVLLLFGVLALAVLSREGRPAPVPMWWRVLLVALSLSTVAAVLLPRQLLIINDAAQGLALLGGGLLLSWFGLQAARWTTREEQWFLAVLFAAAAVSALLVHGLIPFAVLLVPAGFGALLLALTSSRHQVAYVLAAVVLDGLMIERLLMLHATTPGGLSIAVRGEVVACLALLVLCLAPRVGGRILGALGLAWGIWILISSRLVDLLTGHWQDFTDVTLAHRGFESQQVLGLLGRSVFSLAVGLGPAGTVDLSASPDAVTLAASGRVLTAVDDVHLLSSWLLLKLGVAGMVWAVVFLVALVRLTGQLLRAPDAQWDRAVLMFVVAGVVSSLPAATNLFTNPLPMLLTGILLARQRQRALSPTAGDVAASTPAADAPPGSQGAAGAVQVGQRAGTLARVGRGDLQSRTPGLVPNSVRLRGRPRRAGGVIH